MSTSTGEMMEALDDVYDKMEKLGVDPFELGFEGDEDIIVLALNHLYNHLEEALEEMEEENRVVANA